MKVLEYCQVFHEIITLNFHNNVSLKITAMFLDPFVLSFCWKQCAFLSIYTQIPYKKLHPSSFCKRFPLILKAKNRSKMAVI